MKLKQVLPLLLMILIGGSANAQFFKKLKKRVKEAAEESVVRKTEEKVSEKTEKVMDTLLNPNLGKKKKNKEGEDDIEVSDDMEWEEQEAVPSQSSRVWTTYNFVPGDEIIFTDDLTGEENGEFPSRWDLLAGNAENASFEGENIINLEEESVITALIEGDDYLPETFTVEFDAYFNDHIPSWQSYDIRLFGGRDGWFESEKGYFNYPIRVFKNGATTYIKINGTGRDYKGNTESVPENFSGWKHIALAFNQRTLKVFVDEYRALNIPNIKLDPSKISIGTKIHNPNGKVMAIKNIRVAKGGKKLYDRILEEGKFVTRGILFDVNSANIKPESGGVIREVAELLESHPDLRFRIEGHTDSDGADEYNLELSSRRAEAVKEALTAMGIDKGRLITEGKGESVPVTDNTTPEGKANNRRVEFVKL